MVDENKFITDFLEAEQITSWDWADNLKADFIEIMRERLKGTEVCWVNPVVLFTFMHPEEYFGGTRIYWEQRLRESLFQPVAIKNSDQSNLQSAYSCIVNADKSIHAHLTPTFEKMIFESAPVCYRCHFKSEASESVKVEIAKCGGGGAEIKDVPGSESEMTIGHYNNLFAISNPVWFMPSLPFGLTAARSPIFNQYLIGTYIGLKCNSPETESNHTNCACVTWKASDKLKEALDWAIQLFFLRRLKDQGKAFSETMNQYKKQMQMLRLLEIPLSRLSAALDATQEHSQRLRAILYEPSRAIFSIAPRAMVYFEEGRRLGRNGLVWQAVHAPDAANTDTDMRSVKLSLAAVICEVFGRLEPWPENEGALISRAKDLLVTERRESDDALAYEQLRTTCLSIVETQDCFENADKYKKGASRFKEIFYRPLKDGDTSYPLTPMFVGLYGYKPSLGVKVAHNGHTCTFFDLSQALLALDNSLANVSLFKNVGLPVPRYSHWLALLFGVAAYAKAEKSCDISCVSIEMPSAGGVSVSVEFSGHVFDNPDKLYAAMSKWFGKRDAALLYQGNFFKPFVDFVLLAQGVANQSHDGFCMVHDGAIDGYRARSCITVDNKRFCYTSRILDAVSGGGSRNATSGIKELGPSTDEPAVSDCSNSIKPNGNINKYFYNWTDQVPEIDLFFNGLGWNKLDSLPTQVNGRFSCSSGNGGASEVVDPPIVCFVHDTSNQGRWIELAKKFLQEIKIVFISRSTLTPDKDWPDNVDCFPASAYALTSEAVNLYLDWDHPN